MGGFMKKRFLLSIVALLLAGTALAQQPDLFNTSRGRIVFINLERVFEGFYKTQLAKSKIEVQKKDVDIEKQLMVDEMNVIDEDVNVLKKEARDITLSEEIRDSKRLLYEERLLELRDKQKEIEEFIALRQQQLQLQVSRMSQKVMDEIKKTVVDYAKSGGLMAVIDNSARQAAIGVFLYTHPDVDITEDILNVLNSKRPDVLDGSDLFEDEKLPEIPKETPHEAPQEKPSEES
jgi:Skp family chaperone for outer membrane proteins